MIKCRTGYSFRQAAGKFEDVLDRLQEIGSKYAPITDRASTFGFHRWKKAAEARGLIPLFGVELAVTASIHAKKPSVDYWTFLAKDTLAPINRLMTLATTQFRYVPLLTVEQAATASDVSIMTGHRPQLKWDSPLPGVHVMIAPSTCIGVARLAKTHGWAMAASSDNRYPCEADRGFYEVLTGRNAESQSYPQHLLSDGEWERAVGHLPLAAADLRAARDASAAILEKGRAQLLRSSLPVFKSDRSMLQLCIEGAAKLGCDLGNAEYKARMERELALIKDKGYEDYFLIVAEICQWARQRMIARA